MVAQIQKEAFKKRVHLWAEKLDVKVVWLGIRPMRSKWASCSTAGHLNYNNDLLGLDSELWDYVIVHELLHFFVPNHGKLWKTLMRAHLGDWESMDARLRRVNTLRKPVSADVTTTIQPGRRRSRNQAANLPPSQRENAAP